MLVRKKRSWIITTNVRSVVIVTERFMVREEVTGLARVVSRGGGGGGGGGRVV